MSLLLRALRDLGLAIVLALVGAVVIAIAVGPSVRGGELGVVLAGLLDLLLCMAVAAACWQRSAALPPLTRFLATAVLGACASLLLGVVWLLNVVLLNR